MKKGFTLIELLAVIVILAVIALIAVPIILNVIKVAKQGAAESSTLGYIDAVEKQVMINKVKNSNPIEPGEYSKSELAALGLSIKGEVEDALVMINEKGKVIQGRFCINGYSIDYDGKQSKVNESVDYCDHIDSMVYVCSETIGQEYLYPYNGSEQTFTVPCNGTYKLEVWGASGGGDTTYIGGYGAYAVGTSKLNENDIVYINVGGQGEWTASKGTIANGGYNGGGSSQGRYSSWTQYEYEGGGGGATSMALVQGTLNNLESYKGNLSSDGTYYISDDILIVGAGGGSAFAWYTPTDSSNYSGGCNTNGGHAGGIAGSITTGTPCYGHANYLAHNSTTDTLADQITPGRIVGTAYSYNEPAATFGSGTTHYAGGGGSGFFGGGSTISKTGGGSSYIASSKLKSTYNITKSMYCYDCQESNVNETLTISTTGTNSSLDATNCPDGYKSDAVSKCAKTGNGYAKITYLGR